MPWILGAKGTKPELEVFLTYRERSLAIGSRFRDIGISTGIRPLTWGWQDRLAASPPPRPASRAAGGRAASGRRRCIGGRRPPWPAPGAACPPNTRVTSRPTPRPPPAAAWWWSPRPPCLLLGLYRVWVMCVVYVLQGLYVGVCTDRCVLPAARSLGLLLVSAAWVYCLLLPLLPQATLRLHQALR